jgi:3-oxoacyl-[acyl-carrier-protein] synthase-3
MAVRAARQALAEAGRSAEEIGVLCHAWVYHQGYDIWSPAHFVANEVGAVNALPFGIQALSNGGAVALQTVVNYLLADERMTAGLATTADVFVEPGILRWTSMGSVALGDGATAALIGRTGDSPDVYRLRSLTSRTVAELEEMYRINVDPTPAPLWGGGPIRTRSIQHDFLNKIGIERFQEICDTNVAGVLHEALDDAGLEADDPRIKVCIIPRVGNRLLDLVYAPALSTHLKAEVIRLNAQTGHLGSGDALANLHDARSLDQVGPGDIVINLTGGGGFTWTCIVAEVARDGDPMS